MDENNLGRTQAEDAAANSQIMSQNGQSDASPGTSLDISETPLYEEVDEDMPNPCSFLTVDCLLEAETNHVIEVFKDAGPPSPGPVRLKNMLVENVQFSLGKINAERGKSAKIRVPQALYPVQIARLIVAFNHVCNIRCSDDGQLPILGVYMTNGEHRGTYRTDSASIRRLIHRYNSTLTPSGMKTTIEMLEELAPIRERCSDPNLIAVNNGIFDYKSKKLLPFTPDKVFLSKSHVNYVPNPTNPVIIMPDGVPWDVVSWMQGLSDDPEIVQLLWEVIGAIIRPYIDWGRCVMPYAVSGCNGKGTFCTLLRGICGPGTYTNITIFEFGQRFQTESLLNATAVIVDENPIAGYLDDAANFKAAITHDPIGIDRKNQPRINFQFYGLLVQCANELPKIRDRTGSLYRRILLIPFDKCYLGAPRPYIKSDYLKRADVLEYVLHYVLHMGDYDKFSKPVACQKLLNQYKVYNDPIQEFWSEFRDQFVWDLLPWKFLYDLYGAWFKQTNPSGKLQSRSSFKDALREIVQSDPDWSCCVKPDGTDAQVRPGKYIQRPEPLIGDYKLWDWGHSSFGLDMPKLKTHYYGLLRVSGCTAGTAPGTD